MSRSHHPLLDLLSGPPPEVTDEIDAAWERAQAQDDDELELCFEADPPTRSAWGELRFRDGRVARRLSASEALALACGDTADDPLSIAV